MVCTRGNASSSDAARHARSVRCTPGGSGAEARRSIAAQWCAWLGLGLGLGAGVGLGVALG